MKLVAVCEPNEVRRSKICTIHSIPPENAFETWDALTVAQYEELLIQANLENTP